MLSSFLALATLVTADIAPPSPPPALLQEMVKSGEGVPEKGMPFPKETIYIVGEVGSQMVSVPGKILNRAGFPIHILINSPGGGVILGSMIMQAMDVAKQRGSHITCGVGSVAASMAFSIFLACDTRYALAGARFLFHPPRVHMGGGWGGGEVVTPDKADQLNDELKMSDEETRAILFKYLPKHKAEWFEKHYTRETLWQAQRLNKELNFFEVVPDLVGIPGPALLDFLGDGTMSSESKLVIKRLFGG